MKFPTNDFFSKCDQIRSFLGEKRKTYFTGNYFLDDDTLPYLHVAHVYRQISALDPKNIFLHV